MGDPLLFNRLLALPLLALLPASLDEGEAPGGELPVEPKDDIAMGPLV